MQATQTIRRRHDLRMVLALNWDWIVYPAAMILGLSLGAFLALL